MNDIINDETDGVNVIYKEITSESVSTDVIGRAEPFIVPILARGVIVTLDSYEHVMKWINACIVHKRITFCQGEICSVGYFIGFEQDWKTSRITFTFEGEPMRIAK